MRRPTTATNKTEWLLLGLALALLAAAVRPSIRGNDGVGHYVYLASLLRGGDLDFTDDYARYDALRQYPYKFSDLPRSPVTGRPSNRYGIGAALLWSPLVLATHGALRLAGSPAADAVSRPYEWAVGLATAFWVSLGLALLYGRLRRELPPTPAAAILVGLILATPLGFYMYGHGSMSHGVSFFAATLLMLAFERAWRAPSAAAFSACGLASGLLVLIRIQDATWVMVVGCALGVRLLMRNPGSADALVRSSLRQWNTERIEESDAKDRQEIAKNRKEEGNFFASFIFLRLCGEKIFPLLCFVIAFLLAFSPQLFVWHSLYGSFFSGPMPYLDRSAGFFSPWPVHFLEALFSARHGVLAWHPLIAVGLIGLLPVLKIRHPQSAIRNFALAGFLAQLYLVACWSMWWAGASFGNRFFISSLPFIALGLARLATLVATPRRRALACGILFLLILWNCGLLFQYATEMIPREDWVPWSRIVRQNAIDVPRFLLARFH